MEPRPPLWADRHAAGVVLAHHCADLRAQAGVRLIGLPRGGVAVAAAMAAELELPLAPWSVRKIGHPSWPELAIGAVAPGGVVLWDGGGRAELSEGRQRELLDQQRRELERRQRLYGDPEPTSLAGQRLVVVDDGIATGLTARAALLSLQRLRPAALILAVPVMQRDVAASFRELVDRLEVLAMVERLEAVGLWYRRFEQLDDDTVLRLLRRPPRRQGGWCPCRAVPPGA